ncbi:profilin [Phycomyces nitens]|nr:profilin [Phycomyces nitens]
MSWQSYVDVNLVGTGKVTKAAIYGLNGSLWAATSGFQLGTTDIQEIIAGFTNPDPIRASGIHINGVKYFSLRADERSIYGKHKNDGVCIVKTTQCILVGLYQDPIQPGECTKVVEGFADYLISVGYVSVSYFICVDTHTLVVL